MPVITDIPKPTIRILCGPSAPQGALRELFYGMEEEGIPWETENKAGGDALALAWEGAQSSRLEVGVGVDGQWAVLNISKLEQNKPLYRIPVRSLGQVRALGANAARLVKKLPLKPLD